MNLSKSLNFDSVLTPEQLQLRFKLCLLNYYWTAGTRAPGGQCARRELWPGPPSLMLRLCIFLDEGPLGSGLAHGRTACGAGRGGGYPRGRAPANPAGAGPCRLTTHMATQHRFRWKHVATHTLTTTTRTHFTSCRAFGLTANREHLSCKHQACPEISASQFPF